MRFAFDAEVWRWEAREDSGWFFVSVPEQPSADIREVPRPHAGFGSVKVTARIGGSEWSTSIFPDKASGCYVLPLKKKVRDAEGVGLGNTVRVHLETAD